MDIKQLRDKFFRECCVKDVNGLQDVNMTPHNTFEWFVKHFGKNTTPSVGEISNRAIEYAEITEDTSLNDTRVKNASHFIAGAVWATDYIKEKKL